MADEIEQSCTQLHARIAARERFGANASPLAELGRAIELEALRQRARPAMSPTAFMRWATEVAWEADRDDDARAAADELRAALKVAGLTAAIEGATYAGVDLRMDAATARQLAHALRTAKGGAVHG
jgi:hypothetical protein